METYAKFCLMLMVHCGKAHFKCGQKTECVYPMKLNVSLSCKVQLLLHHVQLYKATLIIKFNQTIAQYEPINTPMTHHQQLISIN